MSLNTGRQINSYQWQELSITDTFIARVEEMATAEEAPEMIDSYPKLEWIPGNPITDGYKNEYDDKSEYERSKGVQEEIPLEDEVEIHEPLEDEYAIQ